MNENHLKLLKILNENNTLSYSEITNLSGWSRYMINKYISEVNSLLYEAESEAQIKIIDRVGITISGSKETIEKLIRSLENSENTINDKRIINALSILIDSNNFITIQEMADKLYVSRSTFEGVLRELRSILKKYDIEIIGTKNGIKIDAPEKEKRTLIADIINSYKNRLVAYSNQKEELKVSIKMADNATKFIDMEIIEKVADVIMDFIYRTNLYLTEYEFNSLTIHIGIAMERIKKKFIVNKSELNRNYNFETNTLILVDLIQESFHLEIPEFEKQYIDIHIKSIQQNNYNRNEYEKREDKSTYEKKFREFVYEVLSEINPDEELINDLELHLKSAINRLKNNVSIRNPYLYQIKSNFIHAFEKSKEIIMRVEDRVNIEFDEDEVAYIAIHIQSFFERNKENEFDNNVILVCGSGYGTSKLLEQRLINYFGNRINIEKTLGIGELSRNSTRNRLIISTVPIENRNLDYVYVSPLLTKEDIKNIESKLKYTIKSNNSFIDKLEKDFFEIEKSQRTERDIVIKKMVQKLLSRNFVDNGIFESIIQRENLSSTAMGRLAMPHGEIKYINKPVIYIYINSEGISWGKDTVEIVFLILLNDTVKEEIEDIYRFFNEVISSEKLIQKLINVDNYEEFVEILKKEV